MNDVIRVTLTSEMDQNVRNGRNGNFLINGVTKSNFISNIIFSTMEFCFYKMNSHNQNL